MSFVGLYMRRLSDANGFQILFYRSIGICLVVCFVCCLKRRTTLIKFLRSIDRSDLSLGLALSLLLLAMCSPSSIPQLPLRYSFSLSRRFWRPQWVGFG